MLVGDLFSLLRCRLLPLISLRRNGGRAREPGPLLRERERGLLRERERYLKRGLLWVGDGVLDLDRDKDLETNRRVGVLERDRKREREWDLERERNRILDEGGPQSLRRLLGIDLDRDRERERDRDLDLDDILFLRFLLRVLELADDCFSPR